MTDPDDDSPFPEPVSIPIRDSIDLHYFRAAEIGQVVDAYLCCQRSKPDPLPTFED